MNKEFFQKQLEQLKERFTEHPRSVGETYWQHLWYAMVIVVRLLVIAVKLTIHALFPFLLIYSASDAIKQLHIQIQNRINDKQAGSGKSS